MNIKPYLDTCKKLRLKMEPLEIIAGLTLHEEEQKKNLETKKRDGNITVGEQDTLDKLYQKEKDKKISAQ
jgi:hypothetical protein